MEFSSVMAALEQLGSAQIRNIFLRHGAPENTLGVKVGDMKMLVKQIRKNHPLALQLYTSGNPDAMYLAGLIAEPRAFSPDALQTWAEAAPWYMISEYTVPWMAAESNFGLEMARKWINSPMEHIAAAGWTTWANLLALLPDDKLDLPELLNLLQRVEAEIKFAPNRVRYAMNGFIIAIGSYVISLQADAQAAAKRIGKVEVDLHGTACSVPDAVTYIRKVEQAGKLGKKKKTVIC